MSQSLHLVLKSAPTGHRFDASGGLLTLQKAGTFVVTLQQYTAEIERIDREIQAKVEENKKGAEKFQELYNQKNADGQWTAAERQSHAANQTVRDQTFNRIQGEVNALQAQKTTIRNRFNTINWCWQIAGNGVNAQQITHNASFTHGIQAEGDSISFPEMLEGGGLCWLEVFGGSTDPAMGRPPHGMFVKATGTPRILRCEWTDYEFKPISGAVAFGSEVLLHVYTGGLFGQEVGVALTDRDLFTFNDPLPVANAQAFTREVNVHKIQPFEVGKPGVGGLLTKDDAKPEDAKKRDSFVQKIVIQVLIDPAWENKGGSSLKIYPVVKSIRTGAEFEGFERAYLEVSKDARKYDDPTVAYTNNPVLAGAIETDPAVFHPCKYEAISFKPVPETEEEKAKIVFDKARQELQIITVPVICPDVDHMKNFEVELKALSVTECRYKGTLQSHQNNTFKVVRIPENFKMVSQSNETLAFKAAFNYHPSNDNTLEGLSIKMLEYIWPAYLPRDNRHPLELIAQTCRYSRPIKVVPYPDVQWTFDLRFGMKGPEQFTHTNLPTDDRRSDTSTGRPDSRFSNAQTNARNAGIKSSRGYLSRASGMELEFQLVLSAEYNQGEKLELAAKYEAKIKRFLELLVSLKEGVDKLTQIDKINAGHKSAVRAISSRLLKAPIIGNVDYPVISIGGKWQAAVNEQNEVYTSGKLMLRFTPLIKADISLDIIAAVSYVPAFGQAVRAIEIALNTAGAELNFLLTLFGQVDVEFEYALATQGGSNLNLAGELGLKLVLSAKVRVNMNAVLFRIEGEVEASGQVVTSIAPKGSVGHDEKGAFVSLTCDFKGIKIVVTVVAVSGSKTFQYDDTYVILEEKPKFVDLTHHFLSAGQNA